MTRGAAGVPAGSAYSLADTRRYLAFGDAVEGKAWIGRTTDPRPCPDPIGHPQVKAFASLVQDANRSYWDAAWAGRTWGAVVAPPGTLMVWSWPLPWLPKGMIAEPPLLAALVPLPGDSVVNAATTTDFHRPMLVGDHLAVSETVQGVSDLRQTSLGPGHFVTTVAEYTDLHGAQVATHRNVLFRYTAAPAGRDGALAPDGPVRSAAAAAHTQGDTADITSSGVFPRHGQSLPPIRMAVTLETCVQDVAATRDFLPVHYDAEHARAAGAPNSFLNTMFNHGFLDRICTDWAGPTARITRRDCRFVSPVLAGADVTATGAVTAVEADGDSASLVTVDVCLHSGTRLAARSTTTLRTDYRMGRTA